MKLTVSTSNSVDLTSPIETSLDINYTDDYNDYLSSYPITITKEYIQPDGNFIKLPSGEYVEIISDYEICDGPIGENCYLYQVVTNPQGSNYGGDLEVAFCGFKPELTTYTINNDNVSVYFDFDHPSLLYEVYSITSGTVELSKISNQETLFKFSGSASYWDNGSFHTLGDIEGQIVVSCY